MRAQFEKFKDPPECPDELVHVWEWFDQLYDASGNGHAPTWLTYQEIEAFSRMSGHKVRQFEARLLHECSRIFVEVWHRRKHNEGSPVRNVVSMHDSKGLRALFEGKGQRKRKK